MVSSCAFCARNFASILANADIEEECSSGLYASSLGADAEEAEGAEVDDAGPSNAAFGPSSCSECSAYCIASACVGVVVDGDDDLRSFFGDDTRFEFE